MAIDLIDTARPKNSGAFPIVDTNEALGGLMSVADATARDAIPAGRLRHGMLVFTQDDETFWRLEADLTTWTEATFGGADSSVMTSFTLLSVAPGGSDVDALRPTRILGGDYSARPFATMQAALDSLGKDTNGFYHRITVEPGSYDGFTVQGFSGGGVLDIAGEYLNATLTTGVNVGIAGAGTTGTAVKKPAAAANWTAGELRGKLLLVTDGGGYYADSFDNLLLNGGPCLREIKDNTTDTIEIELMYGLDSTTQFRIVDVAALFDAAPSPVLGPLTYSVGVVSTTARMWLRGLKNNSAAVFYGFLGQSNRLVEMYGIDVAPSAYCGIGFYDTDNLIVQSLRAHGGSESHLDIYSGGRATLSGVVLDDSRLQGDYFRRFVASVSANACTGTALRIRSTTNAIVQLDANTCSVTPLVLKNINQFEIDSAGLSGANASAAYGVQIDGAGYYALTGASLAGAADLVFDGTAVTWSALSGRNYFSGGAFAYWSDARVTMLGQFRILNNSSTNYDDLQVSSIQIETYKKEYSANRALPTSDVGSGDYSVGAYAEIIPGALGTYAGASIIGTQQTLIRADGSTADDHSVRFFTEGEKAGVGFGTHGSIRNGSGFRIRLYPPTGKKIFLFGADQGVDAYIELQAGRVEWLTDKDGHMWVD